MRRGSRKLRTGQMGCDSTYDRSAGRSRKLASAWRAPAIPLIGGLEPLECRVLLSVAGTYGYATIAVDPAGNESPLSAAVTVTIDSVAPSRPSIADLQTGSDTGTSNGDEITNAVTTFFDVTVADAGLLHLSYGPTGNEGEVTRFVTPGRQTVSLAASEYLPYASYPVSGVPGIVTADLNLDGAADLVIAGWPNSNVKILMSNGDGTFEPPRVVPVSFTAVRVAAADLNGDGKPDLVVSHGDYSLDVLLGKGDGTFQSPVKYGATGNLGLPLLADATDDGKLDIVLSDGGNLKVGILVGNGDGTFQAIRKLDAMTGSARPQLADIDHDGKVDLLTIYGSNLWVYKGRGSGQFGAHLEDGTVYAIPGNVRAFDSGDMNGDGYADFVTANGSEGKLTLLLANADGTLRSPQYLPVGQTAHDVTIGDFNLDGIQDVVALGDPDYAAVLFYGLGNGTFQPGKRFAVAANSVGIGAGDFNRDGRLDLVSTGTSTSVLIAANGSSLPEGQHRMTAWLEDAAGNASPASDPLEVTIDRTAPAAGIPAVIPDPNSGIIDQITIRFTERVWDFDISKLILTRNGGANLLSSAQALSTTDRITWTLSNLSPITFLEGSYDIRLPASAAVIDAAGNPQSGDASRVFAMASTSLPATPADDSYLVRLDAAGQYLLISHNAPAGAPPTYTVARSAVSNLLFHTLDGRDALTLDFSNGSPIPSAGLTFTGGEGDDLIFFTTSTNYDSFSSTLDITNNTLLISNSTLAQVESWIKSTRLFSSSRTEHIGLAPFLQADGSILVKLVYNGDMNADGVVNALDYFIIDSNFLSQTAGAPLHFTQGDLNLDSTINALDYFLIDSAFLGQASPGAGALAASRLMSVVDGRASSIAKSGRVFGTRRIHELRSHHVKKLARHHRPSRRVLRAGWDGAGERE